MSFTWGAVIGFATPIPYFYSVFFIVVLIHRCSRDFERCVIVFFCAVIATNESHFNVNFSLKDRRSGIRDVESDGGMVAENNREGNTADFARQRRP